MKHGLRVNLEVCDRRSLRSAWDGGLTRANSVAPRMILY